MYYYKATVQYDGTNYYGFQWQKGIPSIQQDLNLALGQLIEGKVTTMSSSRTDTGVHASEQIVKITTEVEVDDESFIEKFNTILPEQIRCLKIIPCDPKFNPTKGHRSKEYRYLFTNLLNAGPNYRFLANNPYPLDFEKMNRCVELIKGEHSFHNFVSMGSNVKTTIRVIHECELTRVNPHDVLQGELFKLPSDLIQCYQLRIVGNGFLKQMVRHLMSALWHVGNGRISIEEFELLLRGPMKEKRMWKVASARGLHLYKFN